MKIVFKIKEDDARNPGVIADCTGDNAGDSVGPSADGFETYGVTGVALITFILLAVPDATVQVQLLVWIFVMRMLMVVASALSLLRQRGRRQGAYANADAMNFEAPLTSLVWITSVVSVVAHVRRLVPAHPDLGPAADNTLWWKLATIITCGTLAGAIIPEVTRSSPRPKPATCARSSRRRARAARRSTSCRAVAGNFSASGSASHRRADGDRLRRQLGLRTRRAHGRPRPSSRSASSRSASSAWARSRSPSTPTAR
jgi:K(+)-stimulated pyrophosphate-energized sodium pump